MCTVTFVNSTDGIVITSNRDEQVARPTALKPAIENINGKKIIFPKDPKAGGTWFAADDNNNFAVLLNGASEWHEHKPPYRRSRGLILLDILSETSPYLVFNKIDLVGIEPFTIVLLQESALRQLRWDGEKKDIKELPIAENHIWSSATLYSKEVIVQREDWFRQFLIDNPIPNRQQMQAFHNYTHAEDATNGLIINRNDFLRTFSITQFYSQNNSAQMLHIDLLNKQSYTNSLPIQ